jgi:hypothetical protein
MTLRWTRYRSGIHWRARLAIALAAIAAVATVVSLTESRISYVVWHSQADDFKLAVAVLGGFAVALGVSVPRADFQRSKPTCVVSWLAIVVGALVSAWFLLGPRLSY